MRMKIKLQTVIDAIEQASDAYTMLYDTKTNETVYLPDVWITGETDEDLSDSRQNMKSTNTASWTPLWTTSQRAGSKASWLGQYAARVRSGVSSKRSAFKAWNSCGTTIRQTPTGSLPNDGAMRTISNLNKV